MKPLSEFTKCGNRTSSYCKPCVNRYSKEYHRQKRRSRGIQPRAPGVPKSNGFHKLTAEQQNKCLQMLAEGKSVYAVAKYLNKSPRIVYYWRDRNYLVPSTDF
jgi:DNA-binding NarL/FixJ family response regulator